MHHLADRARARYKAHAHNTAAPLCSSLLIDALISCSATSYSVASPCCAVPSEAGKMTRTY